MSAIRTDMSFASARATTNENSDSHFANGDEGSVEHAHRQAGGVVGRIERERLRLAAEDPFRRPERGEGIEKVVVRGHATAHGRAHALEGVGAEIRVDERSPRG